MINFAIIQLSPKHTEIFGTFIELIKYNHWNLVIYYDINADSYTFLNYYQQLFGKLDIRHPSLLKTEYMNYNYYIFSSSGDDTRIADVFKTIEYSNKSIYVMHQAHHLQSYMKKTIKVSPVININSTYILPIYKSYYNYHNKPAKKKNNFAVIGAFRFNNMDAKDKDIQYIIDILEQYPDSKYKIYFYMRSIDWKVITKKYPIFLKNKHVYYNPGLTTEELIEKMKNIKFILPLAKKDGLFYWQRLTGTIPFAINLNIPLIIDTNLAKIYNLEKCSFLYDNNLVEIFDEILNINKNDYYDKILSIMKYKKNIYKQNNRNLLQICLTN